MILSILKKVIIFLVVLFAIILFFLWSQPPEARKPMIQAFMAKFRPTVYLDCEIASEEIEEMEILTPVILPNADKVEPIGNEGDHIYTYTNPKNIKKIMDYICNIKLTKAERGELANKTPSTLSNITLYLKNGARIYFIDVYDKDFIRDTQVKKIGKDGPLYRSRKGNVIEGIKKLDLVESDDRDN